MARTTLFTLAVVVNFNFATLLAQHCPASPPQCTFEPPPEAFAFPVSKLTCRQNTVRLEAADRDGSDGFRFFWTWPDGFRSEGRTVLADRPGIYTYIIVDEKTGRTASANATVLDGRVFPKIATIGGILTCRDPQTTLHTAAMPPSLCFEWSGPNHFSENIASPTVAIAGTYTLTATEPQSGCTASSMAEVLEDKVQPVVKIAAPETLSGARPETWLNAVGSSTGNQFVNLWWSAGGFSTAPEDSLATLARTPDTYTLLIANTLNGCTASKKVELYGTGDLPKLNIVLGWGSIFDPNLKNENTFLAATPFGFSGFSDFENMAGDKPDIKSVQKLRVFDRSHRLVFMASDCPPNLPGPDWEVFFQKNNLPAGLFFWSANVEMTDGRRVVLEGKVAME